MCAYGFMVYVHVYVYIHILCYIIYTFVSLQCFVKTLQIKVFHEGLIDLFSNDIYIFVFNSQNLIFTLSTLFYV